MKYKCKLKFNEECEAIEVICKEDKLFGYKYKFNLAEVTSRYHWTFREEYCYFDEYDKTLCCKSFNILVEEFNKLTMEEIMDITKFKLKKRINIINGQNNDKIERKNKEKELSNKCKNMKFEIEM